MLLLSAVTFSTTQVLSLQEEGHLTLQAQSRRQSLRMQDQQKNALAHFREAEESDGKSASSTDAKASDDAGVTTLSDSKGDMSFGHDMTIADARRFIEEKLSIKDREALHEKHKDFMKGTPIDSCSTCAYVIEKIKMDYRYQLQSMCVELFSISEDEDTFGFCNEVLAVLSVWGNNVKSWLHDGCDKTESYGAVSKIQPCPSHVICAHMKNLKEKPFCKEVKSDYDSKDTTHKKCPACIYALERIRAGYPSSHSDFRGVCVEMYSVEKKEKKVEGFAHCMEVLTALSMWGNNVDSWIRNGCFKSEPYGSMSKITPCPSHVICSQLEELESKNTETDKKTFCKEVTSDFEKGTPT